MATPTATIDKIKLPDGTTVNLSTNQYIKIPEGSDYTIKPQVTNFSGSVTLISGQDYKLTITS